MKIAIFHNYMDNIGGAEYVSLTLARELGADIYSTAVNENAIRKMGFDAKIKKIGKVPVNAPFRQQIALSRFRKLNLRKKYDFFIICGDWAMSGAVNNKPNLWYVHSPIREIWDLYEYTRKNNIPLFARWIFDLWVKYNRRLNKKYAGDVGKLACNSALTKERVRRYLGRNAAVIHPPVETSKFHYSKSRGYWLSVNRLITHKRVEMQARAFAKMPDEKLIIVGSYERAKHFRKYADYIKKIKPKNAEILSWVDDKKLIDLYANCKGFIATSHNEDFGMTAVEAMASGKPVIAPNEGGYKETVINNVTGKLIDGINADKLADAVKEIGKKPEKYKNACIRQAKKFDTSVFIKKIKREITNFEK